MKQENCSTNRTYRMTAKGTLFLVGLMAFDEDEPDCTPEPLGLFNKVLALAAQQGFKESLQLRTAFANGDEVKAIDLIKKLSDYVGDAEIFETMGVSYE